MTLENNSLEARVYVQSQNISILTLLTFFWRYSFLFGERLSDLVSSEANFGSESCKIKAESLPGESQKKETLLLQGEETEPQSLTHSQAKSLKSFSKSLPRLGHSSIVPKHADSCLNSKSRSKDCNCVDNSSGFSYLENTYINPSVSSKSERMDGLSMKRSFCNKIHKLRPRVHRSLSFGSPDTNPRSHPSPDTTPGSYPSPNTIHNSHPSPNTTHSFHYSPGCMLLNIIKSVPETNSSSGTNSFPGTNSLSETNSPSGTNSLPGTNSLSGTNSIPGTNSLLGTNSFLEINSLPGINSPSATNSLLGANSLPGTNTLPGTDSLPGNNSLPGTDSLPGTNSLPGTITLPGTLESNSRPGTETQTGNTSEPNIVSGTCSEPGTKSCIKIEVSESSPTSDLNPLLREPLSNSLKSSLSLNQLYSENTGFLGTHPVPLDSCSTDQSDNFIPRSRSLLSVSHSYPGVKIRRKSGEISGHRVLLTMPKSSSMRLSRCLTGFSGMHIVHCTYTVQF